MDIKIVERSNTVGFGSLKLSTPFLYTGNLYVKVSTNSACRIGLPACAAVAFSYHDATVQIASITVEAK